MEIERERERESGKNIDFSVVVSIRRIFSMKLIIGFYFSLTLVLWHCKWENMWPCWYTWNRITSELSEELHTMQHANLHNDTHTRAYKKTTRVATREKINKICRKTKMNKYLFMENNLFCSIENYIGLSKVWFSSTLVQKGTFSIRMVSWSKYSQSHWIRAQFSLIRQENKFSDFCSNLSVVAKILLFLLARSPILSRIYFWGELTVESPTTLPVVNGVDVISCCFNWNQV